jgi:hypothetical protein
MSRKPRVVSGREIRGWADRREAERRRKRYAVRVEKSALPSGSLHRHGERDLNQMSKLTIFNKGLRIIYFSLIFIKYHNQ